MTRKILVGLMAVLLIGLGGWGASTASAAPARPVSVSAPAVIAAPAVAAGCETQGGGPRPTYHYHFASNNFAHFSCAYPFQKGFYAEVKGYCAAGAYMTVEFFNTEYGNTWWNAPLRDGTFDPTKYSATAQPIQIAFKITGAYCSGDIYVNYSNA